MTPALWRIATPGDAGAIHPIRRTSAQTAAKVRNPPEVPKGLKTSGVLRLRRTAASSRKPDPYNPTFQTKKAAPIRSGLSNFDQQFGLRHCGFCFFNDRAECIWFVNSKIGEDFAVHFDASQVQAIDET
jgi:hypothetical protein